MNTPLRTMLDRLRAAHLAAPPDYRQRMDDLARLRSAFKQRLDALIAAMAIDFGRRSRHEALLTDGMTVLHEIDHVRRHLRRWMKPERRRVGGVFAPARAELRSQPLGVVGVIAPWNYPVNLALIPLASAIGAGNHVMLKPSEHTPRTADALRELLAATFPDARVATVIGDASVAAEFAALPFDHLLFTGSTEVGRRVMSAAAANLTPVTLELGGKSPAIVAPDFPLDTAAARIGAGKFLNAGQTCIAPDYVLVPNASRDAFAAAMQRYVTASYPAPASSVDYTTIVDERQFERLEALVADARAAGARVMTLPREGAHDRPRRVFAPTLVLDAPESSALMQQEIFGPILPIVGYDTIDDALAYVAARPRPLALYHFDHDRARTERVLERSVAGGVTVNDCILHNAQNDLPFGGIGPSGMGHYHGRSGFLTFSKQKPVFYQARMPSFALLRPPYRGLADLITRFMTR